MAWGRLEATPARARRRYRKPELVPGASGPVAAWTGRPARAFGACHCLRARRLGWVRERRVAGTGAGQRACEEIDEHSVVVPSEAEGPPPNVCASERTPRFDKADPWGAPPLRSGRHGIWIAPRGEGDFSQAQGPDPPVACRLLSVACPLSCACRDQRAHRWSTVRWRSMRRGASCASKHGVDGRGRGSVTTPASTRARPTRTSETRLPRRFKLTRPKIKEKEQRGVEGQSPSAPGGAERQHKGPLPFGRRPRVKRDCFGLLSSGDGGATGRARGRGRAAGPRQRRCCNPWSWWSGWPPRCPR